MERRNFLKGMVGLVAVATGVTSLKAEDGVPFDGVNDYVKTDWIPDVAKEFTISYDCKVPYDLTLGNRHMGHISDVKFINRALSPEEVEEEWKRVSYHFDGDGRVVWEVM